MIAVMQALASGPRSFLQCAAVLVLCLTMSGCQSARVEGGLGFGLGLAIQIPGVIHVGGFGGKYAYLGHDYGDRGWHVGRPDERWEGDFYLGWYHEETLTENFWADVDYTVPHACTMLFPASNSYFPPYESKAYRSYIHRPQPNYRFELDAYLLFFSLRLGWNPWYLFHSDSDVVGSGTK